MATSQITHKTYNESECVFLSNMIQAKKYLENLGGDALLDIIYTSEKRPDALVFVFPRNEETRKLKILWDRHEL